MPKNSFERLIIAGLVIMLISFYIHGSPSEAYFPVLFPMLSLVVGWGISRFKFLFLPLIILVLFNSWWLFNHRFGLSGLSLEERLAVVDQIITYTAGQPFQLVGQGEGSQHATFLDNYRYLLWWRAGVEPSPQAQINVTISQ